MPTERQDEAADTEERRSNRRGTNSKEPSRVGAFLRTAKNGPRIVSIPVGVALVIAGAFGFLPIVGFWMLPLGLAILAGHVPLAARLLGKLRRAAVRTRQFYRNHGRRR